MTPVTTLEPQQGGRRQNWGRRLRRPLSIIGTSSLGASGDFSVDSILEESLSKTDHVTPECIQRPRAVSTYIPAVTHNAEDSDEDEDDDYLHGIDHSISKWISINEHPPQTTTTNNYTTDTTPCIEKGSIHTATTASTEEEDDEYPVQTHDDTLFLNNRGIVWVGGLDRPEKTLPAPIYEHRLVFDDEDDDQPFSNRIRSIWVN
ncbi:hypothetical protein TRICI_002746 [Trichomonascus ciferrii]|uniref:Uncharacterized protein n=1 Tax=Trichomonascus ciferrii TaxID=44093 RepID=A0A642V5Y0_9ASCO|nr:hypothetical protein TRICI_002746 [Trichomonascus ciferrii]